MLLQVITFMKHRSVMATDSRMSALKWRRQLKGCVLMIKLLDLTHWGRVTHICVSKLTSIGSDNGLSPGRRQAIIWTIAGIFLIQTLGTNFSEILREIYTFSFKKMHLKTSSGKCRPSCLGLNVLSVYVCDVMVDGQQKPVYLIVVSLLSAVIALFGIAWHWQQHDNCISWRYIRNLAQ